MPLYEYECDSCAHRFEVIQKFSDAPIETCPKCGSAVHKLMSSPAIQFKGSGWYITDYAKKDSAAAGRSGGSKDDSAGSGDSANKGGDSASDAKSGGSGSADAKSSGSSEAKPAAATAAATSKKTD